MRYFLIVIMFVLVSAVENGGYFLIVIMLVFISPVENGEIFPDCDHVCVYFSGGKW